MPQFRNDGTIAVDFVADYPTDISDAATSISIATEISNFVSLIGAKGSEELNSTTGWVVQPSSIPLEGYAGPEVGSLAGAQTYPESSLTWLSSNNSNTIWDLFDPATFDGTTGAIVWSRLGKVVGGFYELFPVDVGSRSFAKERNVPGTFTVNFSLNAPLSNDYVA